MRKVCLYKINLTGSGNEIKIVKNGLLLCKQGILAIVCRIIQSSI